MTRLTRSQHHGTLLAAHAELTRLCRDITRAIDTLDECQPGYPSGGTDGPGGLGSHSDRTGDLAARTLDGHPDQARRDRDDLDHLTRRIAGDVRDASDIARRWLPPSTKWRDALATEAATSTHADDAWCTSCLRVGSLTPRRSGGGTLCRWCQDVGREVGGELPIWLVEKRRQGGRVTQADIDRARQERPGRKRSRSRRDRT